MASLKDVLHELVDHAVTLFDRRTVLHEEIDNLGDTVSDSTPAEPPAPAPLTDEEAAQLEALQARKSASESPAVVVPEVPEVVKPDGTV